MEVNQAGLDLIKKFEGLKLEAYPDPASGGEPYTIGYGRAHGVKPGMKITQAQAEDFLLEDVSQTAARVEPLIKGTVSPNQFAALVAFAYNVGVHNLATSTLLTLLNEGKFHSAADQFLRWDKAGGKEMAGLLNRRKAERELFLS